MDYAACTFHCNDEPSALIRHSCVKSTRCQVYSGTARSGNLLATATFGSPLEVCSNGADEPIMLQKERLDLSSREEVDRTRDDCNGEWVVAYKRPTKDDPAHRSLVRIQATQMANVVAHHPQQRERHVVRVVPSAHGQRCRARLRKRRNAEEASKRPRARHQIDHREKDEPEALLIVAEQCAQVAQPKHRAGELVPLLPVLPVHLPEGGRYHVAAQ
mmetsp:Transcript_37458/g.87596  ORF Transcript_37458/g.87596 Transcript_37458/m.87596 type:complete len:216 (+) Transcript_37458:176-823(+)